MYPGPSAAVVNPSHAAPKKIRPPAPDVDVRIARMLPAVSQLVVPNETYVVPFWFSLSVVPMLPSTRPFQSGAITAPLGKQYDCTLLVKLVTGENEFVETQGSQVRPRINDSAEELACCAHSSAAPRGPPMLPVYAAAVTKAKVHPGGAGEGASVGITVGAAVGTRVGTTLGASEGMAVGASLDAFDETVSNKGETTNKSHSPSAAPYRNPLISSIRQ